MERHNFFCLYGKKDICCKQYLHFLYNFKLGLVMRIIRVCSARFSLISIKYNLMSWQMLGGVYDASVGIFSRCGAKWLTTFPWDSEDRRIRRGVSNSYVVRVQSLSARGSCPIARLSGLSGRHGLGENPGIPRNES